MTFHAPQTNGRLVAMIARRLVLNKTSIVAVAALVSTTVVVASRANSPDLQVPTSALADQLSLSSIVTGSEGIDLGKFNRFVAKTLDNSPDLLSAPSSGDLSLTSDRIERDLRGLKQAAPLKATASTLADSHPFSREMLESNDRPIIPALKSIEVASLAPPNHDWDTLDSILAPRFPDLGPVPLAPPSDALSGRDVAPEIHGHETGPNIVTVTAHAGESLESMLQRGDLRDEDHRATLVALRADSISEDLIEGDMIDLAFLSEDDNQLLGIRLRQLGQPAAELRWDGQTTELWEPILPDVIAEDFAAPLAVAPETLSVTGKRDDTTLISGVITSSLYSAASKAGLSAAQTKALSNIFRYSVDFQQDLRKGDRFEALFAKDKNGSYGDILYAKLTNRGSEIALYRGTDDVTGEVGYFDVTGKSNKRALMRTPVAGARISSHYGMRHHPVLGYNKMHRGTDFAAPRGTPIFAAGDGIVEYAGRKGAYGKYIRIRHNGMYQTAYAHMSRFAAGVTSGGRVRQGDVIGYVGSTGRSTGPHLHFEILQQGNQINPMDVADFGATPGLAGSALSRFKVRVSRIEIALTLMRNGSRVATIE